MRTTDKGKSLRTKLGHLFPMAGVGKAEGKHATTFQNDRNNLYLDCGGNLNDYINLAKFTGPYIKGKIFKL